MNRTATATKTKTKLSKKPPPAAVAAEPTVLVMRTSKADGGSHGGFRWPEAGPVEAPDWDPSPVCGHGLHGLLWGDGAYSHLQIHGDADQVLWQVVEVLAKDIVAIDECDNRKVKFPRGVVVFSKVGDFKGAADLIASRAPAGVRIHHGTSTSGNGGTSTSGDRGTGAAGEAGIIAIRYWDDVPGRYRLAVGYPGEDGIKSDTKYRVEGGKLVEVIP